MLTVDKIENFNQYSNFKDLQEFNEAIRNFLTLHKQDFTKSELVAFKRLVRYSAKVAGVSNIRINSLLNAIRLKDFSFGISESTFHRMKRKAIKLGILEVKEVFRKNESQSSNLWVFKRFEGINCVSEKKIDTPPKNQNADETASAKESIVSQLTPLKTRTLTKTKTLKDIKKRIGASPTGSDKVTASAVAFKDLDHTYTADYVPKAFVMTVKPFYDNAKTIEEFWRMARIDTFRVKGTVLDSETVLHTAINAFKQMIGKLKKGLVKNPVAYFKGVLKQMIDRKIVTAIREELEALQQQQDSPSHYQLAGQPYFYNWLEERD